jgi:DNA-binding response OmpR family regulator
MNILILDDEVYLAHKMEARLQDEGYHTSIYSTMNDVDLSIHYDTILLSTNLTCNIAKVIDTYRTSVVILLVTFVSEATVTKLINQGASDYILKPFVLDELVRKIKHFEEFNKLQKENLKLTKYLDFVFSHIEIDAKIPHKPPFLIQTNENLIAKKIVFDMAKKLNKKVKTISLQDIAIADIDKYEKELLYLYDFDSLKKNDKKTIIKICKNKNIIISSNDYEDVEFEKVTYMSENKIFDSDTILTVNDYVKYITLNFQSKYPDTELSKRLGISRKSLWEKRKKFGIEKKKR